MKKRMKKLATLGIVAMMVMAMQVAVKRQLRNLC